MPHRSAAPKVGQLDLQMMAALVNNPGKFVEKMAEVQQAVEGWQEAERVAVARENAAGNAEEANAKRTAELDGREEKVAEAEARATAAASVVAADRQKLSAERSSVDAARSDLERERAVFDGAKAGLLAAATQVVSAG